MNIYRKRIILRLIDNTANENKQYLCAKFQKSKFLHN